MSAGRRVHQLPSDAHPLSGLTHAAFEHVAHAEVAPDLLHVNGFALVRKARIARDHEQPWQARNRGSDLLDHAVGEIFLLRVAAHVGKGKDRDRRLVREGRTGSHLRGCRASRGHYPVCPDWPRDVLERLLPHVFEGEIEAARCILLNARGNADTAWFSQGLEACRDIDPVAEDVAILDHYVALVNADAKLDPTIWRHLRVSLGHFALYFNRATHRIDDAGKFEEQAIARSFDDATVMFLDLGVGHLAPKRF